MTRFSNQELRNQFIKKAQEATIKANKEFIKEGLKDGTIIYKNGKYYYKSKVNEAMKKIANRLQNC